MKKLRPRNSSRSRHASLAAAAGTTLLLATSSVYADAPAYQFYDVSVGVTETISDNLSNAEGASLQKSGEGTLILTGSNTYTGSTEVIGGILNLSGSTASINQSGAIFLTTGTLNIIEGSKATTNNGYIGWLGGNVGAMSVSGAGSTWTNNGSTWVGASGTGTFSITNGGTVNTTSSAFIGGYAGSKGTVLLSGSGSSWSTGTFFLGDQGEGSVTVEDGATLNTGSTRIANQAGSTGSITITGSNTTWTASTLFIGSYGTGSVSVEDGATAISNGPTFLGETAGTSGTLTVKGAGSSFASASTLWIGSVGTGTVDVLDGATITSAGTFLGSSGSSSGTLNIDGEGSTYTNDGSFYVGNNGSATLSITNGGILNSGSSTAFVAAGGNAVADVTISGTGSTWNHSGQVYIGNNGTTSLTIENGGTFSSQGTSYIAAGSPSVTVEITGAGSSWVNDGDLQIANSGNAMISVLDGALLSNSTATVAGGSSSSAQVLVSGSGSAWINTGNLNVGGTTGNSLRIADGGLIRVDGGGAVGSGTLTLSGDQTTLIIGGTNEATDAGTLQAALVTTGFANAGQIVFNHTDEDYEFASNIDGNLVLLHVSGNTTLTGSGSVSSASVYGGSLSVSGLTASLVADDLTVSGSNSYLRIADGGLIRVDGGGAVGSGTLTLSGDQARLVIGGTGLGDATGAGTLQAALVTTGSTSHGTIVFNHTDENYEFASNLDGNLGIYAASGNTTLTGSGLATGLYIYGGSLSVSGSTASFNVETIGVVEGAGSVINGGRVFANDIFAVGVQNTSSFLISGSGSAVESSRTIIGSQVAQKASLQIAGGGSLNSLGDSYVGMSGTGVVTVTGVGSSWITAGNLWLGEGSIDLNNDSQNPDYQTFLGAGSSLTIADGGYVRIDDGGFGEGTLVLSGSSRSVLNIGAAPGEEPQRAGILAAGLVTSGSLGGGTINFNHTSEAPGDFSIQIIPDGYYFTSAISGDIEVNNYAGRTILSATNDYTGDTTVYGGTLVSGMEGALSSQSYLTVTGSSSVYDLNGYNESVVGFTLAEGGSLINGSLASVNTVELEEGTLSAILSGTAGVIKSGTGTVIIENDQLYTGDTVITNGTVRLVGSNVSDNFVTGGAFVVDGTAGGNVTVLNGILKGTGIIGGNLYNNGILSPGHSPGTLTVVGNYDQTAYGTYFVEVEGKNRHDRLIVGGTAELNGKLQIKARASKLRDGDKVTILRAGGGVEGEFSKVRSNFDNTLRGFEVDYRTNSVVLEYVEGSFLSFAKEENLTDNQQAVGRALDKANSNGKLRKLLDNLYDTTLPELDNKLAILSPEDLTQIYQIGFANAQTQYNNLDRRLSDVRDGAIGFSTNGLALSNSRGSLNYDGMPITNSRDGLTLAGWDGKSVVGKQTVAPIVEQSRWGFFATGNGEWADVETTAQARGSEFTTGGVTLGVDYRVSDNFVVGIAGGYANSGSDLNNGGSIDVNSGRGNVYASVFGSGFYLNTTVGGAYNAYDTKRGTLGGKANGDTEGGEFNSLIGGGYDYRIGGLSIGPVASLQYTYLGLNGYTESGSDAPLTYGSQSQDSLKSSLGARASYAWNVGGLVIKPEVRAQWQHEFLDSTASLESAFVGGAGTFTVNGPSIGRDSLLLDAGVSVQFNPAVAIFAYYTGEIGRQNYSSNAVNGGFRINF